MNGVIRSKMMLFRAPVAACHTQGTVRAGRPGPASLPQARTSSDAELKSSITTPSICHAAFTGGVRHSIQRSHRSSVRARAANPKSSGSYDYDLVIIGCGVGGHGAALHAVEQGMKVAIIEGHDIGGTCVNRGCVPSKALLAAAGRLHELRDEAHLAAMGIAVNGVSYDREGIAKHANGLAKSIQGNLERSLVALGVDILIGNGKLEGPNTVSYGLPGRVDVGGKVKAKNVIIATGSVPFVPPGVEVDGKTVITSDHALKLEWVPDWMAIIGSGYIGLEMMDVYTALGTEVTLLELFDTLAPGFDPEIQRMAKRLIVDPKTGVDWRTGVMATKVTPGVPGVKPALIEMVDFKTKEPVESMEVDCCLVATGRAPFSKGLNVESCGVEKDRRGYIPVDDKMQVLDKGGKPVPGLFAIGDVTGKYMLAHAASAQGIVAVENMMGRPREVNYNAIPAAVFTHPEISSVGMTEDAAREKGKELGFQVEVAKTAFKANSKALAEKEGNGMAKLMYRRDTGEIMGVHIIGLHAADLIHEVSNAVAMCQRVQDLQFNVHAHPTLSEVMEELLRQCKVEAPTKHPVAA